MHCCKRVRTTFRWLREHALVLVLLDLAFWVDAVEEEFRNAHTRRLGLLCASAGASLFLGLLLLLLFLCCAYETAG